MVCFLDAAPGLGSTAQSPPPKSLSWKLRYRASPARRHLSRDFIEPLEIPNSTGKYGNFLDSARSAPKYFFRNQRRIEQIPAAANGKIIRHERELNYPTRENIGKSPTRHSHIGDLPACSRPTSHNITNNIADDLDICKTGTHRRRRRRPAEDDARFFDLLPDCDPSRRSSPTGKLFPVCASGPTGRVAVRRAASRSCRPADRPRRDRSCDAHLIAPAEALLREVQPDELSPREALELLYRLKAALAE